jgi:diaminopropionate ammonia-lyase
VVEGYSTMLAEADEQLKQHTSSPVTHAFASVGVGSWAHAVTLHYKSTTPAAAVVTVEPDTAACLKTSLETGKIATIETGDTIMCGMNCGTVSMIAWPVLNAGVDAAVTITDVEAHQAVKYLLENGVQAGPCGAAPLAALRKVSKENALDLGPDSVVVLFCTEGAREYPLPN